MLARALALVAFIAAAIGGAAAQSVAVTDHAETRLVAERDGFAPGQTTFLALDQAIQDGWHVYWKNPGDSGLPLELIWTLPEGFEAGAIVYPTPERIEIGPLANFGHHGRPAFLVPVTAPADAAPGSTATIGLTATWLICEEICVPETASFSLSLPVGTAPAIVEAERALFAAARAAAPAPYDAPATFSARADALRIEIAPPADDFASALFFPEPEGLIEPAAAQQASVERGVLRVAMKPGFSADAVGERVRGVLVLTAADGSRRGYEIEAATANDAALTIAAPSADSPAAPSGPRPGLFILLAGALLGGVLLNIMPCVFPVIFIKAATLMKAGGADRAMIRRDGYFYTAGVVATFAALGGLLVALRAGGEAVGWGFHLQSPIVVLVSAYVLFLVGLNLAGVFEIGSSLQNTGGSLAAKGGPTGAFFTGALAVAVAAPCIGPFLTAPIGAAAFLPAPAAIAIFLAMGLGLALPYLVLSLSPALGRLLPKPGAWMTVFRQALSFPVFASAAYFLWVLAEQTGSAGLAVALLGAVLLAAAAWAFELSKASRGLLPRVGTVALLIAALAPALGLRTVPAATAAETAGVLHGAFETVSFDAARLAALRAEGRPVFIDFTAAWCVACQFNKLTVFSKPELAAAFTEEGVAFMVADWTRRDPAITEALAQFGANGVPLYVFYPAGGEAEVLPLPLSEAAVIKAIRAEPVRASL